MFLNNAEKEKWIAYAQGLFDRYYAAERISQAGEDIEKRYEMTDQIPPRKDINATGELSKGIKAQLAYASPMPTIPQLGTYWSSMNSAYSGIWDGDDVRKDLNAAAAAMEAAK